MDYFSEVWKIQTKYQKSPFPCLISSYTAIKDSTEYMRYGTITAIAHTPFTVTQCLQNLRNAPTEKAACECKMNAQTQRQLIKESDFSFRTTFTARDGGWKVSKWRRARQRIKNEKFPSWKVFNRILWKFRWKSR